MKNDMLGLIFAENPEVSLGELASIRSLAAVPVGGRYRIIDFMLSNIVNSHMFKAGITAPHNYQSLTDHLGTGKDWDMDRKDNGLFILPPRETADSSANGTSGIDVLHGAMPFLEKSRQEYVLVADCNTICNMSFNEPLEFHEENEADITVIYAKVKKLPKSDCSYMHMFIIKRTFLMELINDAVAHGKHSISKDIFLPFISKLKICAYEYTGYLKKIDSIKSYFEFNLELLKKDVRDELFGTNTDSPIYTKVKDTIPTKYAINNDVSNSFIADGCIIEGTVKNSILFRGVHIGKGAKVENCILMQDSEIMDNCLLENVIFDKEVVLRSGKKLVGQDTYPMVISKHTTV
ncbi:MAG: sugar phosphate nucleotidyltransferase [Oscillospiraceae bacterium]